MAVGATPGVAQHKCTGQYALYVCLLPVLRGELLQEQDELLELPPADVPLPTCQKGCTHIHLQARCMHKGGSRHIAREADGQPELPVT